MKIDASQPVGKIAAEVPGAIGVFEALGIDYACSCERSLDDAAHALGIVPGVVIASLRRLESVQHGESWSDRPLRDLTRFLSQQHHHFIRHDLGRLTMLLSDVCVDDGVPSALLSLRAALGRLVEMTLSHLHFEETRVFREIEAMENDWQSGEALAATADLTTMLRQVADEHALLSEQLRTTRELRLRLADSAELPSRYRLILQDIAMLEAHFHEYMFLENWILLPRVAALATQDREVPASVR